jgi:hypothetical protein
LKKNQEKTKENIYISQPKEVNLRNTLEQILFSSKQSPITMCCYIEQKKEGLLISLLKGTWEEYKI